MSDQELQNVGGETELKELGPPDIEQPDIEQPTDPAAAAIEETVIDPIAAKIEQYDRDEADKEDPKLPEGEPNVILAPSREHDALPAGLCNIGLGNSVMIPKKAQQLAGFYAPKASVLVHQFPQYKFVQQKGQPKTQKPTTGQ